MHLVNLPNPRLYGGPLEDTVRVGALDVAMHVDAATAVSDVRLLRSGDRAAWNRVGDPRSVVVPAVDDFEVVAIEIDSA